MMSRLKNVHVAAFVFLLLLGILQIVSAFPQLPLQVASRFGSDGAADGWSGRNAFTSVYVLSLGGLGLLFFVLYLFIPKIPPKLINMPWKKYWLAPERKEKALLLVARQLLIMGNGTLCFVLIIFKSIIAANLVEEGPPALGWGTWVATGAYCLFVLGWMVALFWMLKPPPSPECG